MTRYLIPPNTPCVALVTNGGLNLYLFRQPLLGALRQRGWRILLLAPFDTWVERIPSHLYDRYIPLQHFQPYARYAHRDRLFFQELYRHYGDLRPDVVLHFTAKPNIYGSLAASLRGIPSIPTVTGLGHGFMQRGWLRLLLRWGYFMAFRQKTRVFFHNQHDRRYFHRLGIVHVDRSAVVPGSGVDVRHFAQAPLPGHGPLRVTCIARMIETKGIRDLMSALRIVRAEGVAISCTLVGPLVPDHPRAIPPQDIRTWESEGLVKYLGHQLDVRPYLLDSHLFALPSYSEGMPRAVLEAMAVGRPILTTSAAGCAEAIDLSCGWRVTPRSPRQLAFALRQAATASPETLARMGQAARQRVARLFRDDQVADYYLRAITEICSLPIQPIHA